MKFKNLLHGCMCASILTGLSFFQTDQLNAQYTQVGMDIEGEATRNESGVVSLSADGMRVAIGAPNNNDPNGTILSGHVRVYDFDGTTWAQVGADIDGVAARDFFGRSVSLSANGMRLASGASEFDGTLSRPGYVKVFDFDGTNWVQVGTNITGENAGDQASIVSLSADGARVAIGADRNAGGGQFAGHVRVFEYNGTDWVLVGTDIDGEVGDSMGESVSLSEDGSRLAAGANTNDDNGMLAGQVRVFDFNGTDWVQVGFGINGEAEADQSGGSISLSANGMRLAIGAPLNDGNGDAAGHVRVFDFNGTDWEQVGTDIDGEALEDQAAVVSLSADGARLAVGAGSNNNASGDAAGHVRVFDFNGTDWMQVGADIDGEARSNLFGNSVSLSSNGGRLAVGAPRNSDIPNGIINRGHVRVFGDMTVGINSFLSGTPSGQLLIYPNPYTGDQLSWSIPDLPTSFQSATLSIHDTFGKLVMSKNVNTQNTLQLSEPLASGIYFVSLNTGERAYLEKLIVR